MSRPRAILLLVVVAGRSLAAAGELPPLTIEYLEQVVLRVSFVATGPEGSVSAGEDEIAVLAGEWARLEREVDLAVAGGPPEPLRIALRLTGRSLDETYLELALESEVSFADGGPATPRSRSGRILDGGSLLSELFASPGDDGRRLIVFVEGSRRTVPLVERKEIDYRAIDLVLDISHVEGEARRLLETVRMTTLPGRPVDYGFRLHLPAERVGGESGEGYEAVSVTVRALPRRLPDGRVDLLVSLNDARGRPWTAGEPLVRAERRTVEPGEGVTLDLGSLAGDLVYRFHVAAYF